jgi:Cdc6-like AAA superfamily ATPase
MACVCILYFQFQSAEAKDLSTNQLAPHNHVYAISHQTELKLSHKSVAAVTAASLSSLGDIYNGPSPPTTTAAAADSWGDAKSLGRPDLSLFAGYESQVRDICHVINMGTQTRRRSEMGSSSGTECDPQANSSSSRYESASSKSDAVLQMFKRPKGILICGPRGTGKSLLMREIGEWYEYHKGCSVHRLSHDILLSRWDFGFIYIVINVCTPANDVYYASVHVAIACKYSLMMSYNRL